MMIVMVMMMRMSPLHRAAGIQKSSKIWNLETAPKLVVEVEIEGAKLVVEVEIDGAKRVVEIEIDGGKCVVGAEIER